MCQWCRAVENGASSVPTWTRSLTGPVTVVLVADGSMWLVRWLQNFVFQLQYRRIEPVECQSLQIADADVLILCGEYCRKSDQSTSEVKYLVDCVHDSDDNSSLSHSRCTLRFGVLVQVGVKITLGSSSLTKIVTFTPYYVLINQAKVGCFSHYNSEHSYRSLSRCSLKCSWCHVP